MNQTVSTPFTLLLDYLKRSRGFDFSGYKHPSLMRRIEKRMQTVGVSDFIQYVDYLEVHPDEFAALFNTILINVTGFFRDPLSWEYIQKEVVPQILREQGGGVPPRIWSAGCASGEEAYTLAIILAEALGLDTLRERVKIYATDVDEDALNEARQATYSARQVAGVPAPLLERYFETGGSQYTVHKDLRRAVIFGRHDLLKDAPISRIDLLTCRNALMYFNAETQTQVMTRLHFALKDGGFLFLGKAEMLFTHASLFTPVDLKRRVFAKTVRVGSRERLLGAVVDGAPAPPSTGLGRMREQVFDAAPVAQIIVEAGGTLALANERARLMFHLGPRDLGRPLQDLEVSYRPVELRSCIEQVYADRHPLEVKDVLWGGPSGAEKMTLDVHIAPFIEDDAPLGVCITFSDMTRYKRLQQQLEESNHELETAYEELQSTNEELETTNEELQSTVEELETTNEELQSTNEELETMNEELQSTNEELQAINEELQSRSWELNQLNTFFTSILTSMQASVIVLDRSLQIQVWNRKSEDLWGLRGDEVLGKPLTDLDTGLPMDELGGAVRASLNDTALQEFLVDATNRRGRVLRCRVICNQLISPNGEPLGIILIIEEV